MQKQALQKSSPASPIFVEAEKLFDQMKDFSQSIARRAYDYFEARGREWGHELEDWFKAEADLLREVPVEIVETEKQLNIRAEVPGFQASEIKVSFEPRFLTLSGTTEQETTTEGKTVYSERRSQQFYRRLSLPTEVDTTTATAALKDGVLELTVAKATKSAPVNVEVKPS